jgi:hypothetical protein
MFDRKEVVRMSIAKLSVEELIHLLLDCPTGLHIEQLEQLLWKVRKPKEPIPKNFRASIYGTLSLYSSQSLAFKKKRKAEWQDLFFSPDGKGSGVWAVHRERAESWLHRRALLPLREKVKSRQAAVLGSTCSGNRATVTDVRRSSSATSAFKIIRQGDL